MKRLIVLGLAFIIMFGLRGLSSHTEASLTLAAVGFVVLAAFTVGELGARLGAPKVTGYIIAGVMLGPQVGDILSTAVVEEMRVFNTLALGLIATSAGLELDLKAIRRVWKVLTAVVVLKVPLLILLVGGAFVAVETMLPSLNLPPEAVMPLALVVAVLGIGTSPAIALAVVNDSRSKGRLTDLLLAIAVVKDLVVVVCLAIALALAKAMLDPTAHLDAHVLIHVAEELGSSIFVGAILGVLLIGYMRFVRKQMLLMAVLMILVVAELSATLHLELLLVFIMAGFLVRNFSPYEHDLLEPIERIALPVFVVFFTTAGAGVDLIGTVGLLPLALSLVFARVVAFYIAGRLGGAIGGEGPGVVKNAWLTWLPQAGVTLGLVFLAAKALPDFAAPLTAIGMALVAIHLLVGPITLGMGLSRAGEVGAASVVADGHGHGHGDAHADEHGSHGDEPAEELSVEAADELAVDPTAEVVIVPVRTVDDVLAAAPSQVAGPLLELARALEHGAQELLQDAGPHLLEGGMGMQQRTRAEGTVEERLDRVSEAVDPDPGAWLITMEEFVQRWMGQVQALPEGVALEALAEAPAAHVTRDQGSSLPTRVAAQLARLRLRSTLRSPPLRMLAREALEHRLAVAARDVAASRVSVLTRIYEKLGAALLDEQPDPDVQAMVDGWVHSAESVLQTAIVDSIADLVAALEEYASPLGRPTAPQYSKVEGEVRQALVAMRSDDPRWEQALTASVDQLRLTAIVAALSERMQQLHSDWGVAALDDIEAAVIGAVDVAIEQVEAIRTEAQGSNDEDWSLRMKAVFPLKSRIGVRMAAQAFRQRVQPDRLTNTLVGLFDRLPEQMTRTSTVVSKIKDPRELSSEQYAARKQFRNLLLDERVPELCRTMDMLVPQLESAHIHIAEGVEVAAYGLSVAHREASEGGQGAAESLERSAEWLRDYRTSVVEAIGACRNDLEEERVQTMDELRAKRVPKSGVSRVQSNVAELSTLVRARVGHAGRTLARGFGLTTTWLEQSLDDPRLMERSVRMGVTKLDPQAMREALLPMRRAGLPKGVEAMFSMRPVDDRRQFIARRPVFERLQHHLASPDAEAPLLALVSGARSSGRTSLVNVLQLSARKLKVVRPEEAYHDRATGVMAALAKELQCSEAAIEAVLTSERTFVILDNLERFFLPTQEGLDDLAALLRLAAHSAQAGTQWVMTAESEALARLDELTSVSGMFNQHVRLEAVGWQELETVLRGRARLGGFEIEATLVGTRLQRLQWAPGDLWFQRLEAACGGNLGGAIAAWRSAVEIGDDRTLRSSAMEDRTIPFFSQLSVRGRAVVASLNTWGPMTIAEMAVVTGIRGEELSGHLQVLCATGLVRSGAFFEIDPALLQPVHYELLSANLCHGGAQ